MKIRRLRPAFSAPGLLEPARTTPPPLPDAFLTREDLSGTGGIAFRSSDRWLISLANLSARVMEAEPVSPSEAPAVYGWSIGLAAAHPGEVIAHVEQGFDARVIERFKQRLALSTEELADLINTSSRTLSRRQKQGHLEEAESDRLYRLVRLYERAVEVLGNEPDARLWMKRPQWGLGGAVPLRYARTEPGAREVEALLDRIDYGVLP